MLKKTIKRGNKASIEDANILSETTNETNPLSETTIDDLNNESQHNNISHSKTIDVDEKKEKPKVQVDFMDEDFIDDSIKKETKRVKEEDKKNDNITAEDIVKEEKEQPSLTLADMMDVAEVVMNLIDLAISTSLRWWSKDTSDQAYSITYTKKSMLVRQLATILLKYQAKFRIEFLFLISLIIVYAVPFGKAKERRKLLKMKDSGLIKEEDIPKRTKGGQPK
jgi:hypothetical protein